MNTVDGPEIEEHDGVVEIQYESDGVLAVQEGTRYATGEEGFEVADTDQLMAIDEGTEIYLEPDSGFQAYAVAKFAELIAQSSSNTDICDPKDTKIWDPDASGKGSTTPIFDPSEYDIGDPTEYVSMMKENADTIILELADRGVTGDEASETLDQLFESMNDTYDRFVDSNEDSMAEDSDFSKSKPSGKKRKLTPEEASKKLEEIEQFLRQVEDTGSVEDVETNEYGEIEEESQEARDSVEDYVDARELLREEGQTEIFDFENSPADNSPLEEGQSEMSDWT